MASSSWFRSHAAATSASLLLAALAVGGCGGGSGGDSTVPALMGNAGTISGNVVKGPVSGASVSAFRVVNGVTGSLLASATTDAQGGFTMAMGDYAGPVMLQASGGSYVDEATGLPMRMGASDAMTAVIPAGGAMSGVQMTPLTSMAQAMAQHMPGGLSTENIVSANGAVGGYFAVDDIVHTPPMNPLVAGSGASATRSSMNYGMTLAAMSQYAKNLDMPVSSTLASRMRDDASDGVMDGMANGSPIMMGGGMMAGSTRPDAGTSGLATSMMDFIGSGFNHSGVGSSNMADLMQKLAKSDGHMH